MIARNFELIDPVLSSCVHLKAVSRKVNERVEEEKHQPTVSISTQELGAARLRLACLTRSLPDHDKKEIMTEDVSVFSLNNALTSLEAEKFFRHSTEDLVAYLANKHDLPY